MIGHKMRKHAADLGPRYIVLSPRVQLQHGRAPQVTVLGDLWVIRQLLARDMPRKALLWAGLPRRLRSALLLLAITEPN